MLGRLLLFQFVISDNLGAESEVGIGRLLKWRRVERGRKGESVHIFRRRGGADERLVAVIMKGERGKRGGDVALSLGRSTVGLKFQTELANP